MELQELKTEIEALKTELNKLIDLGASFNEIYIVSVKLDKLIVVFHKDMLVKSV